ncbi:MAG: lamin tail domain-containing protein [Spirochaetota bacterium]
MIDGARREDDVPRWMNHFYDPVNERGLTDSTLGSWQKSKDWAQDSNNQNKSTYKVPVTIASILTAIQQKSISVITDETDFTWQRAVKFYVAGDKEKAMFILGHILHLIEDASVPEHTRNDSHALGSPYEDYAGQFSVYNPDGNVIQRLTNKGPIVLDSLNSYFNDLTSYSNNYFYSADTIGIQSGYGKPVPVDYEKINELYYALNNTNDGIYKLSVQPTRSSVLMNIDGIVSIDDKLVLDSYWSHLSTKSIQYGAGVVNLFFQEVEAAKNDPNFNTTEEKSFIGKAVETVSNLIAQASSAVNGIISSTNNFLTGIFSSNDNFKQVEQVDLDQNETEKQNINAQIDEKEEINNLEITQKQTLTTEKLAQEKLIQETQINKVIQNEEKNETDIEENLENKIENNIQTMPATAMKQCSFITNQIPSHQKIIINEVAWMGTLNSASDEWIELKNISSGNVDVNNWQLIDRDEQIEINFTSLEGSKIIGTNKFILLERTDNESVQSVSADLIYNGALSNTNDGLRLFDSQCNLVDEILANPDWPAGNASERKTMERDANGFNWHTSSVVNGTPKVENSTASALVQTVYSGGGSINQIQQSVPIKILLNEIQISPISDRFVRLYNPNDSDVNLTNWYIQRKTKTGNSFSSLISKTYFENKIIPAKSYFMISRSASGANVVVDDLTLTEGNSIQIRNSSGDIIDKVGWGESSDCEGICALEPTENQSIKRKLQNNEFVDTDNNSNDFEIKNIQTSQSNQAPNAFFDYSPESPQAWQAVNFNAASSTDSDGQIISYEWSFGDGGTLITSSSVTSHIYSLFGSYQISLVVFDNQGVSSTPATANIPVSISGADHIVISEIMAGSDSSANNEFIELYNPTNQIVSLADWSLKRKFSLEATSTENLVLSFDGDSSIGPSAYFLVVHNDYADYSSSTIPDFFYTNNSNPLAYSDDVVILYNGVGGIVDEVYYQSINKGQSIERKAWVDNACALSQESAEFSGNACDSNDDDDFDLREIPNPQNSFSLPEPRVAPTKPGDFNVQYNQNIMELSFGWNESQDYSGATSTLVYKIFNISNASATLSVAESTSTAVKITVSEVGRDYQFSIQAFDKDGFGSDAATSSTDIPSFLSGLYFYQNPQDGEVLIDAYYGQYPFIPDLFNKGNTWKAAVFYLNNDAKNDLNNPSWQPNDLTDVLELKYSQCAGGTGGNSLILPDINNCSGFPGGAVNRSFSFSELEDNHFIIKTIKSSGELSLNENDFITVAFYSVLSIPTFDGLNPEFQLVATDRTKYYFGIEPERQTPVFIGEIVKNFDNINSRLNLSWSKAMDIDTLDNILTYEIKYNDEGWGSTNNATGTSRFVSPDESFLISVRAKDNFNNYSTSTFLADWAYPPIVFSLVQSVNDGWSANFGKREGTNENVMAVNIQSITPAKNLEFNKVVLRVKHSQDSGASFNLKLLVFGDSGGKPDFNNLLSTSNLSDLSGDPQNRDLVFSFSPNVVLSSGVKYWFVLENSSYTIHSYSDLFSNSWQSAVSSGDVYSGGESGRAFMIFSGAEASFIEGSAEINPAADWYMKIGLGE